MILTKKKHIRSEYTCRQESPAPTTNRNPALRSLRLRGLRRML
jgi:hypothetical protein